MGQLSHLDHLLSIDRLRGIQWIPGAGQKPRVEWPEVYARILAAGKRSQTGADLDTLRAFVGRSSGPSRPDSVSRPFTHFVVA